MPIDEGEDTTDIRVEIDIVDPESGARPLPAEEEPDSMEVRTEIRDKIELPADMEPLTIEPQTMEPRTMDPRTSPKMASPVRDESYSEDHTIEPRTAPEMRAPRESIADAENTIEPQLSPAVLSSPAEEDPSTLEPNMSVRSIDGAMVARMREVLHDDESETGRSIVSALEQSARESSVAWEEIDRRPGMPEPTPRPMPAAGAAPRKGPRRARTLIGIAVPPEVAHEPYSPDTVAAPTREAPTDPAPTALAEASDLHRDTIVEMTEKRKPLFLMTPNDPIRPDRALGAPAPPGSDKALPSVVLRPRPAAGAAVPPSVAPETAPIEPPPATAKMDDDDSRAHGRSLRSDDEPLLEETALMGPPRTQRISSSQLQNAAAEVARVSSERMQAAANANAHESGRLGIAATVPAAFPPPGDSSRSDRWNTPLSPTIETNLPSVRRIDPALVPPMAISHHSHPSMGSNPELDGRTKGKRSAAIMMAAAFMLAGAGASALIVWQATKKPAPHTVASAASSVSPPIASVKPDEPPPADSTASADPPPDKPQKGIRPRRPRHPPPPGRPPRPVPAPAPSSGKFDPTAI